MKKSNCELGEQRCNLYDDNCGVKNNYERCYSLMEIDLFVDASGDDGEFKRCICTRGFHEINELNAEWTPCAIEDEDLFSELYCSDDQE